MGGHSEAGRVMILALFKALRVNMACISSERRISTIPR